MIKKYKIKSINDCYYCQKLAAEELEKNFVKKTVFYSKEKIKSFSFGVKESLISKMREYKLFI